MTIGIIGAGNVGGSLGAGWAKAGHVVIFGSRNPEGEVQEWVKKAGAQARAASVQEAVAAADVLVLATPWKAAKAVAEGLGDLHGKVLIDLINPLLPDLSGL